MHTRVRKRTLLAPLPILAILIGLPTWSIVRHLRQEQLNRDVIAAIKRNDATTALALLNAGADANALDTGDSPVSARQVLRDWWDRLRGRKPAFHCSALILASQPFLKWDGTQPPFNDRSVGCFQPPAADTHSEGALSRQDKTLLAKLRQAVLQMDDKKASFQRFERQVPAAQVPTWQRLLPKVRPNSEEYVALSFALAYDGVDYEANLQRLLRPYRLWHTKINVWEKEYPEPPTLKNSLESPDQLTDLDYVYSLLNLLYLKHHDLKSLGLWLDLRLDGAWAEGSDEYLSDLWQRHANDMLRAAYHSPSRLQNLADAFELYREDNPKARRALLADLKARTRTSDPHVAAAARKLILLVQKTSPQ